MGLLPTMLTVPQLKLDRNKRVIVIIHLVYHA